MKNYATEKRKLEFQHIKKLADLRKRIEAKYAGKIEKEYVRKEARLNKELERKLHNLQIEMPTDNRVRKLRVKKPKKTDYANACEIAQLIAKLNGTDAYGVGECICCPGEFFQRDELDGGHWIAKAKSRLTALDYRNINPQRKSCNAKRGGNGNFERQIPQINKIRGEGTTDELLAMTTRKTKENMADYICRNIPVLEALLESKKFDTTKSLEKVRLWKKRYVKDNDTK